MKTAFILAVALIGVACGGGSSGGGNGDGAVFLVVTELGLNPASGGAWVEVKNIGPRAVRIAGVILTSHQNGTAHDEVTVPSGTTRVPPGGYATVDLDLPPGPGRVEVSKRSGRPIASAAWPALSPGVVPALAGTSYGETSDGSWRVLDTPTPGAPNVDPRSPVMLNEVCADNDGEYENPDAPGEYDDWIELFNPGKSAVDVGGMSLTDDPSVPGRWVFPSGSVVPAGGHLIVFADGRPLGGPHASFCLPAEEGTVGLYAADGSLVDVYAWDQMGEDRSRGRDGDGRGEWVAWRELTPGRPNDEGLKDRTDDPAHRKRSPDYDRVFDPAQVKTLRIEIAPGDFEKMLRNRDRQIRDHPLDPDFRYVECTVRFEGLVWEHVGIRFKGASSSEYPWANGFEKYPLKLDFDEFEDDWPEWKNQRFFGMKKLSLSNGVGDPTYLRELVCIQLMQESGVTVSRAAPYAVFLDTGSGSRYWGLYASVEQVDGIFLKDRYGDDEGNLYKPEGPGASLRSFVRSSFEKKTNEDEADFSDVVELIDVLDAAYGTLDEQKAAILAVFDVESFLPWIAVSAVAGNIDSYLALNHNYYLYHHHDDGRFRFITWDHNQTLGAPANEFTGHDVTNWDVLDPADGYRPLVSRVLEVPEWRQAYLDHVAAFRTGAFSQAAFERRVADMHALLKPWVVGSGGEVAPFTLLTASDHFERGLAERLTPIGWAPVPGLLTFAENRRDYLRSVLD